MAGSPGTSSPGESPVPLEARLEPRRQRSKSIEAGDAQFDPSTTALLAAAGIDG